MDGLNRNSNGAGSWILENLVTIIFVAFTLFGFMVSSGVSVGYFFSELSSRVFRNSFLVLSLIIPVLAGLGLNFGIVIGAMSGQVAIAIARYFEMGAYRAFCSASPWPWPPRLSAATSPGDSTTKPGARR